jgi:hypothetical protein
MIGQTFLASFKFPWSKEPCRATEWATCDDGRPHVYRICDLPKGHKGRWHREMRDWELWAESSGDSGPIPEGPWCEHTDDKRKK